MRYGTSGIIAVIAAVPFLAGCRQPQQEAQTPNDRQARLLAAQSADLQRQLAACQAEIKTLRDKHAQELRRRDDELAACKARIEGLQKDINTGIAERVNSVTKKLVDENARLRREVEQLQAEVRRLKTSPSQVSETPGGQP